MRIYFIYTLTDKLTDSVIYVGKSTNPIRRMYKHRWMWKRYIIDFKVIDMIATDRVFDAALLEEYWINKHISWGEPIQNKAAVDPNWIDDYDFYKRPTRKAA